MKVEARVKRFLTAIIFILCVNRAVAQSISTAQINGVIQDSTGLAVPGAEVKATQTDIGLVRTANSGADGGYILPNLPVGPYQLEVSRDGFSKYVQSGIVLQVGSNPNIDVQLKVGQVSEQVQVEANANLVETRSAGIGQVIDTQRVLELPLNGRQVTELVFLSGMATQVNGAGLNSGVRNFPTVDISVAGGLSNGLTYRLDGATHNDPYNNLNLPLPFPDALQEFKVETSALPAQYGHHSAAAINGVTKSGTNDFHGDVFEFMRNGAVNAQNTFSKHVANSKDTLKRNQFGGTAGGAIIKNKLFFFVGEQSTLIRSFTPNNVSNIPTVAMLAGDFSQVTVPQSCNTLKARVQLKAPFDSTNHVNPASFSPVAVNIMKLSGFPSASLASDVCGTFNFGRRVSSDQYDSLARGDYQLSEKHFLFLRYLMAKLNAPSDHDPANLIAGTTAILDFHTQSAVFGDTYLLGAGTVNSFRATLNRSAVPKVNPQVFSPTSVGINIWEGVPGLTRVAITGGFNIASNNETPSTYNTTDYEFTDDVSLIRGAHQIGFGADYIRGFLSAYSGLNASGPFTFAGTVLGSGLADFLLGRPSAFTQATATLGYDRSNYFGAYVQDNWKLSSRLTVGYGVRWDPYLAVTSKYGWLNRFDPALFAQNVRSTVYTNAPAGLQFVGDQNFSGSGVANARYNNFAPRLSLAWDPKGDGKTSVRAAWGRFFDLPGFNNYIGIAQSPPFGNNTTVTNPASFANPWQGVPGGNPYPLTLSKAAPFINFGAYENFTPNPKTTYVQQWSLSIQRQLGTNWLAQANYVGNNTVHVWGGNQVNPGVYISGGCSAGQYGLTAAGPCSTVGNVSFRRALILQDPAKGIAYGLINQVDDGGTAHYNGLNLSINRRSAKGYSVQANYTWSHCISDQANPELGVAGLNFMIPGNRHADRGNCTLGDRRHIFNLSAVYETPKFANKTTRLLASGWQISPIIRASSGPSLTILSGVDYALTGQTAYERPNQILTNVYLPNKGPDGYLNPLAFANPTTPGTYGGSGRDSVQSPGSIYINAGVTRNFRVHEKMNLQFRAEAFNIPNLVNWGPPNGLSGNGTSTASAGFITPTAALNNPNFGKILSADDPRILQGALKFTF